MIGVAAPSEDHLSLCSLSIIVVLVALIQWLVVAYDCIVSVALVWCSKLDLIAATDSCCVSNSATSRRTDSY